MPVDITTNAPLEGWPCDELAGATGYVVDVAQGTGSEPPYAAVSVYDDDTATQRGENKCWRIQRLRSNGVQTGTITSRVYKGFAAGVMDDTDTIAAVVRIKINEFSDLTEGGVERGSWVPNLIRINISGQVHPILNLVRRYGENQVNQHEYQVRLDTSTPTADTRFEWDDTGEKANFSIDGVTQPVIVPGCWHEIVWVTSGWQDAFTTGLTQQVFVDGFPVSFKRPSNATVPNEKVGTTTPAVSFGADGAFTPNAVYYGTVTGHGTTAVNVALDLLIDDVTLQGYEAEEDWVPNLRAWEWYSLPFLQPDGTVNLMVHSTRKGSTASVSWGMAADALTNTAEKSVPKTGAGYIQNFHIPAPADDEIFYQVAIEDNDTDTDYLSAVRSFKTDPGPDEKIEAVVVGSYQDGVRRSNALAVAERLHPDADLVICWGDIVNFNAHWPTADYDTGNKPPPYFLDDDWRAGLAGINNACFKPFQHSTLMAFIPSNHDLAPWPVMEQRDWHYYFDIHPLGQKNHGSGSKGWNTITLNYGNLSLLMFTGKRAVTYFGETAEDFQILERELKSLERRWKGVVVEYPLFGNANPASHWGSDTQRRSFPLRGDMHDIFLRSGIDLVISGDVGRQNRYMLDGIAYLICPPADPGAGTSVSNRADTVAQTSPTYPAPELADVPTDRIPGPGSLRKIANWGGYVQLVFDDNYFKNVFRYRNDGSPLYGQSAIYKRSRSKK